MLNKKHIKKLKGEFKFISSSEYLSVKGVFRVDSGIPGPILGVTLHTHGNEPSGLGILDYMRNEFNLGEKLKNGSIIFVLNNIRATKKYLKALNENNTKGKRGSRFINSDMNRLPADFYLQKTKDYEISRAQELQKIWDMFDVGLDIHDMRKGFETTDPIIIAVNNINIKLIKGFPVKNIFTNIEKIQIGRPVSSFYGKGVIPVIGLETGLREHNSSVKNGINCLLSLIRNMKMLDATSKHKKSNFSVYKVVDSVIFPDGSYQLVKKYRTYDRVKKGEILATGKLGAIKAKSDGYVFGPIRNKKPKKKLKYEAMFILSNKVKKIVV